MIEMRVWVTCYKNGRGEWTPRFGSYATRSEAIAIYNIRRGAGAYEHDRKKGLVLAMRARLTLEPEAR